VLQDSAEEETNSSVLSIHHEVDLTLSSVDSNITNESASQRIKQRSLSDATKEKLEALRNRLFVLSQTLM